MSINSRLIAALAVVLLVAGGAAMFLWRENPKPAEPAFPDGAATRAPIDHFVPADPGLDFAAIAPLDPAGKPADMAAYRGKALLVNLWATWCVPCRKEMPSLDRLQAQLGGPAFEVVALSIDKSPQAVREFYQQYGIRKLALYIDPSAEVTSTLRAVGIPTTLLVDGDGRERWRRVGPAEWDASAMVEQIRKEMEAGARPDGRGRGKQP